MFSSRVAINRAMFGAMSGDARKLAPTGGALRTGDVGFALLTALALLVAHAIAFMLHEYSHAVVAWLLGFKANPGALHYGHFDLSNILLQQDIDENVDYARIFHAGHGLAVAVIALSGAGIGNGLLYVACAGAMRSRAMQLRPAALLWLFWLALMACGNLWSYAPVRTITSHGDMGNAAEALGISPWLLFPFVVAVSVGAGWHFFRVLLPATLARAIGADAPRRSFVVCVASFIYFGFYGVPALVGNYGDVSAVFSILSLFVLFPLVTMVTLRSTQATGG